MSRLNRRGQPPPEAPAPKKEGPEQPKIGDIVRFPYYHNKGKWVEAEGEVVGVNRVTLGNIVAYIKYDGKTLIRIWNSTTGFASRWGQ